MRQQDFIIWHMLLLLRTTGLYGKSVRIVERGLADAVGLGIDIFREKGIFIANFGGGITELSVLSSGGLGPL